MTPNDWDMFRVRFFVCVVTNFSFLFLQECTTNSKNYHLIFLMVYCKHVKTLFFSMLNVLDVVALASTKFSEHVQ